MLSSGKFLVLTSSLRKLFSVSVDTTMEEIGLNRKEFEGNWGGPGPALTINAGCYVLLDVLLLTYT